MAKRASAKVALTVPSLELSRDIYGFTVRPQHLQRYREYAAIYKEEEAERSDRWEDFLQSHSEPLASHSSSDEDSSVNSGQSADQRGQETLEAGAAAGSRNQVVEKRVDGSSPRQEAWGHIRNTLWPVERALSSRFKKRSITNTSSTPGQDSIDVSTTNSATKHLTEISLKSREGSQGIHATEGSEDDSEDEFYDVERSDVPQDVGQFDNVVSSSTEGLNTPELPEELSPWKEELEALVRGGVPMAMRGELWQVFVGTKTRRTKGHYNALLTLLADGGGDSDGVGGLYACSNTSTDYKLSDSGILEKWTSQIEKDLPRTFPGHPALDDDGRNALRRLLTAYARHNPAVGYCQAMNFFAALLLLMMPEENAFWTLTGIMDDYFEGYYSEKMVEAQVDQLVFEDLVHEHFPRLVNHLDTLGVQVAWVSGPWFLSIFVNILPWESVLRVWDVLLYEGNRSMLFRSALALMELHGPAIMATKDAGDAVAMLQSVAGSTFDSSQLVLTACMGFQMVNESRLQELRKKHRPKVLASLKERSLEASPWHSSHGPIIPGLYNYDSSGAQLSANAALGSKNEKLISEEVSRQVVAPEYLHHNGVAQNGTADQNGPSSFVEGSFIPNHTMSVDNGVLDEEENSVTDLVEQVKWLKIELCRVLEENRATTLRAEELETAFMELVKEDNRRLLTAKVETMEAEVLKLNQILAEKEEQEQAMVKVMLRMEQEQQLTEDARRFAEQDAAAQRHAANVLQEKYEDTVIALQGMEKRAVMAESMLEATLQYQDLGSGQVAAPKRGIVSLSTRDEEPSRWSWPRIPFSPKSVDHDTSAIGAVGSSSNKHNAGEVADEQLKWGLSKNNQIQVADPPRKQGLMSRSFSLSWREKSKERVGAQDLQPAASQATGDFESLSTSSSVSVSPQNSLDSKEPLVPFQGDSNVDPEAHAAEDTSCASGSDMSTERETRKE